MAKDTSLNSYYKKLKRCSITFPCSSCNEIMSSIQYAKHCKTCLNLDRVLECIWCQGKVSWKKFTKYKNVNHLMSCWKQFINSHVFKTFQQDFIMDDLEVFCPAKHMFGFSKIPNLPPGAYEHLFPINLDPVSLTFQHEGINLAVACMHQYLKYHQSFDFFHCMVRAIAFPSFVQAMANDRGQSTIFPFSCWCNGGNEKEDSYRQHRHMIIMSHTKGRFHRDVWKNINRSNFKCILKKPIKSAMHLLNTMAYVSQRESQCNGTFNEKTETEKLNHFWILTALPKNFQIYVALQWDGGIMDLIHEKYQNLPPFEHLQFINGHYNIFIKDLPGIQLNRVLLVSKEFKPCSHPTEYFLYLNQDKKLYFEKDNSLISLDVYEWGKLQANSGNLFYNVVGNELWTPRPFQQMCLHAIEKFRAENAQLKAILQEKDEIIKQKNMDQLNEIMKLLNKKRKLLNKKIKRLNKKMKRPNRKMKLLNREMKLLNRKMKISNRKMKLLNRKMKQKNVELKELNRKLLS